MTQARDDGEPDQMVVAAGDSVVVHLCVCFEGRAKQKC